MNVSHKTKTTFVTSEGNGNHSPSFETMNHQAATSGLDNNYSIKIGRSFQEIEALRDDLRELEPYPTSSLECFLTELSCKQEEVKPYVILLSCNDRPETILLGKIEHSKLELKVGKKIILKPKVRSLTIDAKRILGHISPANSVIINQELNKCLKQNIADVVLFQFLPITSNLYPLALTTRNSFVRDQFPDIMSCYRMTLFDSLDAFMATKKGKVRSQLRRIQRRLEENFPGKVVVKCFQDKNEITQFCRDAAEISQQSWQFDIDRGFIDNDETRQILTILAERNAFKGYILYLDDKPCAFKGGVIHKNIFFGESIGYNVEYKKLSVGMALLLRVIEDLSLEPDIQFIDFGPGDVDYKNLYCDLIWQVASFHMFPQSLKGRIFSLITRLSLLSDKYGKLLLSQLQSNDKWLTLKAKLQSKSEV